ncbi:hypothetical protein Tco_1259179, partial [Tanacetum coccineum]
EAAVGVDGGGATAVVTMVSDKVRGSGVVAAAWRLQQGRWGDEGDEVVVGMTMVRR